MMSINLSDIAILNSKVSDYCCIISLISNNGAIKLLQNTDLTAKRRTQWKEMENYKLKIYKNFWKHI